MYLSTIMRVMFETFRNYSQPRGFGFHLAVLLLSAMAAVGCHRRQRAGLLAALLSLRMRFHTAHKRKTNVDLLDSALESEKYIMRQGEV